MTPFTQGLLTQARGRTGLAAPRGAISEDIRRAEARLQQQQQLAQMRGWPDYPIDRPTADTRLPNRFGLRAPAPPTPGFFYRKVEPGWMAPQRDLSSGYRQFMQPDEFSDTPWYPGGITPWGMPPWLSRGF